jgi:AraC-like DNA-binding protein
MSRKLQTSKEKKNFYQYYINKAKEEKNIKHTKVGYHLMAIMHNSNNKGLIYADSMLQLSHKTNDNFHTSAAIKLKGNHFYKKKNFKKALDYYLKAREYAQNEHLLQEINYRLGLIKTYLEKHREALNLHKEVLAFGEKIYEERKNQKFKYPKSNILNYKYAVANSYKDLNLLDSASYFNKIGIRESKEINDSSTYYFLLNQGTVNYLNKSYQNAIDTLKIAEKYFNKKEYPYNYAETSYYLGESYWEIKNTKKAILYFKKVDSVFNTTPGLLPIVRNSYEHLINHYKSKKDLRKQLKYLVQLKKMDSVLATYGSYANNKLLKEYDLPLIVGETKRINELLEKRRQFLNNVIGAITIVLIGVFSLLVFQYRRRKLYKARFNEVVNTETQPATNELKKIIEELTISKEIVSEILTALDQFERNKKYLNSDITLQSLAKEFNTNANYLSKVINHYKNGSYSKYVTGLRIQFAIDELKTNNTFRKYTIKAIAKEVGFNNPESFSKAFYAKTGIKPSYFIKELEKIK